MKNIFYLSVGLFLLTCGIVFAQAPGTIKWIYSTHDAFCSYSPAVGIDGTIYIGSVTGKLYAINPDGTEKWTFFAGDYITTSPVIYNDSTIYFSSTKQLYALNLDGTLKWTSSEFSVSSTLAIGNDGTIYFKDNNGKLYALDSQGNKKFESPVNFGEMNSNVCSPVIGGDGTLYVTNIEDELYVLNFDGSVKWSFNVESHFGSNPIIVSNGILYYKSYLGDLYALNSDGSKKWSCSFTGEAIKGISTPIAGMDGTIYFSTYNYFHAISNTGEEKWKYYIGGIRCQSPALGRDGTIYIYGSKKVIAFTSEGNEKWSLDIDVRDSSPALSTIDSTLYVIANTGKLYAIQIGCKGLAESHWPKFLRDSNNQNSSYNPCCPVAIVETDSIYLDEDNQTTLDASLSYDPDDDHVNFSWRCIKQPPGSEVILSNPDQMITNATFSHKGVYKISITITDNEDGVSSDIVTVNYYNYTPVAIGNNIQYSTAIDANDVIYYVQDNHTLVALNPDYSVKWSSQCEEEFATPPVIGQNGFIYITANTQLYAFRADGTLEWTYPISSPDIDFSHKCVAVANDGTIYCRTSLDDFSAINPDGSLKWKMEKSIRGSIIVGLDETVYVGAYDNTSILALNPDGTEKWSYPFEPEIMEGDLYPVAIDKDGTLIVIKSFDIKGLDRKTYDDYSYSDNRLIALYENGVEKWSSVPLNFYPPMDVNLITCIGLNNEIYLPTYSNLFSFDCAGNILWQKSGQYSYPLIGDDGSIYLNLDDETLVAYYPDGSEKIAHDIEVNTHLNINSKGVLFFGGSEDKLYALETECSGLAESAWPKYRKDRKNSGSSDNPAYPKVIIKESQISKKMGEQITLDASQSYDPDGGDLSFLWKCVKKPFGSEVVFSNSTQSQTNVTCQYAGPYIFEISVTDNENYNVVQAVHLDYDFQAIPLINTKYIERRYIQSVPAFDDEGYVYVGTGADKVIIFNSGGSIIASKDVYNPVKSAVSIGDETFYIGTVSFSYVPPSATDSWYSRFSALDLETYDREWIFSLEEDINSSIAIDIDGTIYFGCNDHNFYALSLDGTQQWKFESSGKIESSPAINQEGILYVGSYDSSLYAINPDGTEQWSFKTDGSIRSSPAIGHNGVIYFGSDDHNLYAINPDGSLKWLYTTDHSISASPVIDGHGVVYLGSDNYIYAIYPDGAEKWILQIEDDFDCGSSMITNSLVLGDDRSLYFGAENKIYALNSDGTLRWIIETNYSIESPPALSRDGMLYLGSSDSYLYAVKTQSNCLMDSPWPKFRSNYKNTGSLANINNFEIKAAFCADKHQGVGPLSVGFCDKSTGYIVNRNWSFGDEALSNNKHPDHTYMYPGLYSVQLTVSNAYHSDLLIKENYILVLPSNPPIYSQILFSEDFESVFSEKWQFKNSSHWQIKENNNSIYINDSDYMSGENDKLGEYAIIDTMMSENYSFQFKAKTLEHILKNKAADYSGVFGYIDENNYYYFMFNSCFMQTALYQIKNSERTLIQNRYGFWIEDTTWHHIQMTCQDSAVWVLYDSTTVLYCENIDTRGKVGIGSYNDAAMFDDVKIYVEKNASSPSGANFFADTTCGIVPLTVTFTDSSSGTITSWQWDFGDGNTSQEQHPTHVYETADTFNVTLIISGSWGSDTLSKKSYIQVIDLSGINPYSIQAPKEFALYQNYPNPFNPSTNISYAVKEACRVHLVVYNIKGQIIKTLVDTRQQQGTYHFEFNTDDMASGIYFYQIKMNEFNDVKKMIKLE